jgi:hypothetical protein
MDSILHRKPVRLVYIIASIVILLSGCDVNAWKRPGDYPDTTWYCEKPHMAICVDGEQNLTLLIDDNDGKLIERSDLTVDFDFGDRIEIWTAATFETLFSGRCQFSPNYFTVYVENDTLFNREYQSKKLTFKRQSGDG